MSQEESLEARMHESGAVHVSTGRTVMLEAVQAKLEAFGCGGAKKSEEDATS